MAPGAELSRERVSHATLIRGGTLVLPARDGRLRAEQGDLLLQNGRIVRVGGSIEPPPAARVMYASGCAVLPGFVQSHVHLCHTLLRGVGAALPETDWTRRCVLPLEAAHRPLSMRASARLGLAELLLGGTTAIQTMESVHHTDSVLEVIEEAGFFAVVGKSLMNDPETVPDDLRQTGSIAVQEAAELFERWDGRGQGRLRVALSPRHPTSCTDDCLRDVGQLARAAGWRIHMHAAGSRDEIELIEERTGFRTIEYLDKVGCTGSHVSLADCIWLEKREIDLLSTTGTHVLHCPGSNCRLGAGVAPVPELMEAGACLSIGTDGAASNGSLDMFQEMRLAALLHKAEYGVEALPAAAVLDMATRGGAAALGWKEELGVLAPGAWANVLLVALEGIHATPETDPLSSLVYNCRSSDIRAVWLAGIQVVERGRLLLWDEEEVRAEALREAAALFERAGEEVCMAARFRSPQ